MSACFHCGLPVPVPGRHGVQVLGSARELCCAGCEAVARTIVAAGWEKYYETRSGPGAAPAVLPSAERFDRPDGEAEASLILDRIRCPACLWLIENALRRVPGVERADVNYATQRAQVGWDRRRARLSDLIRAVREVGCDAYPYEPRLQAQADRREQRAELWRLFIAAFGAMQTMMYAFPAYVDDGALGADAAGLMRWAGLLITLPVVLFSCGPFFRGARDELRSLRLGLDTPIALGLAGAFAASAWATITSRGEVYFDSIGMLAFLLLGARFLQGAARRKAARMLDPLLVLSSSHCTLRPGDVVRIAPGERIPADGLVEQGASCADESLLTGESRAVAKRPGDDLIGGSVNLEQPLEMRVTRTGPDTRAASIARLVERAGAAKPRLVEQADRAARVLTPVIILTALYALLFQHDAQAAVAILVVTCPCALGLAAPVVITRASAALLASGTLLTRSRALQSLDGVTDVVLDKTGTVTSGRLSIARIALLGAAGEAECLRLAGALEASSRHPIARAFAGPHSPAEGLRHFQGQGIEATVEGRRLRIGSREFCAGLSAAPAAGTSDASSATQVFLADEHSWLARFELEDSLRPEAEGVLAALKAAGLKLHLCSGDRAEAVAAVARRLGIESSFSAMSPEAKLERIEALQREGRVVAMIGDGLNDAPVLARADVSFALGGGADAAQLHADAVLLGNQLEPVREAFGVARAAMRLVRQNLAWALAYNAIAIPMAAAGWLGPLEAALGMGASSLIVLLNASRPLGRRTQWKASTSSSRSPSFSYS